MDTIAKSIEQRVGEAVARSLRLKPGAAVETLRMGTTPGWDSMGHMMVVLELEKEFKTSFPTYRLPELVDVPSIVKALQTGAAAAAAK